MKILISKSGTFGTQFDLFSFFSVFFKIKAVGFFNILYTYSQVSICLQRYILGCSYVNEWNANSMTFFQIFFVQIKHVLQPVFKAVFVMCWNRLASEALHAITVSALSCTDNAALLCLLLFTENHKMINIWGKYLKREILLSTAIK